MSSIRFLFFTVFLTAPAFGQSWTELNRETVNYFNKGQYQLGYDLALKTFQGLKKRSIIDSSYVTTLQNLTILSNRLAKYEEALALGRELIRITNGPFPVEYISACNTVGTTYFLKENYPLADSIFAIGVNSADSMRRKPELFKDQFSLLYQLCILKNSQGLLYRTLGQKENAIACYRQTIGLMTGELGQYVKDTEIYLTAINNLANVYMANEDYVSAEKLYLEALEMYKKTQGEKSLLYLNTLNNLGSLYSNSKQFDRAVQVWREKASIVAEEYGTHYPLYISMLINLSNALYEQEKYEESRKIGLQAKALQEKYYGKENSTYQTIIFNLAHVYQFEKNYDDANRLYKQVVNKLLQDLEMNFAYLTEKNKRTFYHENKSVIDDFSFFAVQRSGIISFPDQPVKQLSKSSLGDLYDLRIATKGMILSSSEKMRAGILTSKDSVLIRHYKEWEALKGLQALYSNLAEEHGPGFVKKTDSIRNEIESKEELLTRRSAHFSKGFRNPKVSWKQIQKQLKPGEAAVELIQFMDGLIYVALIVTPETKKHPEAAIIKSSKDKLLDKQFYSMYMNSIKIQLTDTVSYNRFWKPIRDQLTRSSKRRVTKLYLSSDGVFNRISINTLQNPTSGKYLLDELDIQLVTNTKDLLSMNKDKTKSGLALLVGRPAYGEVNVSTSTIYPDLPGTETEIKAINETLLKNHWQTEMLTDTAASEANVRAKQNPFVLHVATHGFFEAGREEMLSSGIVLAGVHRNEHQNHSNDGLLASYEASFLALDSTSLVVLSACETGLGSSGVSGDGIYGLQRTFRLAGAKTILMSLWKVDDQATKDLMISFYKNWMGGISKSDAFKLAQLEMKQKYQLPYYWGPFVMVGD